MRQQLPEWLMKELNLHGKQHKHDQNIRGLQPSKTAEIEPLDRDGALAKDVLPSKRHSEDEAADDKKELDTPSAMADQSCKRVGTGRYLGGHRRLELHLGGEMKEKD